MSVALLILKNLLGIWSPYTTAAKERVIASGYGVTQVKRANPPRSAALKNLDISVFFSEVKFTNLFSSDCGQSGSVKKDKGE
jgi:hypothetical protein